MLFIDTTTGPTTTALWAAVVIGLTFGTVLVLRRLAKSQNSNARSPRWSRPQLAMGWLLTIYSIGLVLMRQREALTVYDWAFNTQVWSALTMGLLALAWGIFCLAKRLVRGAFYGAGGWLLVMTSSKIGEGLELFYRDSFASELATDIASVLFTIWWVASAIGLIWIGVSKARRDLPKWWAQQRAKRAAKKQQAQAANTNQANTAQAVNATASGSSAQDQARPWVRQPRLWWSFIRGGSNKSNPSSAAGTTPPAQGGGSTTT